MFLKSLDNTESRGNRNCKIVTTHINSYCTSLCNLTVKNYHYYLILDEVPGVAQNLKNVCLEKSISKLNSVTTNICKHYYFPLNIWIMRNSAVFLFIKILPLYQYLFEKCVLSLSNYSLDHWGKNWKRNENACFINEFVLFTNIWNCSFYFKYYAIFICFFVLTHILLCILVLFSNIQKYPLYLTHLCLACYF